MILKVESDDKAKIPFGKPGNPIDSGVRPHGRIIATVNKDGTNNVKLSGDHSYHLGSLTTSVNLFQTVPEEIGHSWVRGKVYVTLNDSVFESSSGWKHAAQLCLQLIEKACLRANVDIITNLRDFKYNITDTHREMLLKFIPSVIFISTDGGSDHKNTNIQNQAAMLAVVLILDLYICIANRNAPDGSWINSVERIMSLLNLGLQWCAFERNKITDTAIEDIVSKCNSITELREKGKCNPQISQCWVESLKNIKTDIGKRFRALSLKDEKVIVAKSDSNDDVLVLQDLVKVECPDFSIEKTTKAALKSMPHFLSVYIKMGLYKIVTYQS